MLPESKFVDIHIYAIYSSRGSCSAVGYVSYSKDGKYRKRECY